MNHSAIKLRKEEDMTQQNDQNHLLEYLEKVYQRKRKQPSSEFKRSTLGRYVEYCYFDDEESVESDEYLDCSSEVDMEIDLNAEAELFDLDILNFNGSKSKDYYDQLLENLYENFDCL